jgi:3-oxoacyl-[acyl-carrier-protein] synthase II
MSRLEQKIAIAGIGCVGGFGCGTADFIAALQQGYAVPTSVAQVHPDGQAFLPAFLAATDALTDYVPRRALRRIDHYARMALLGGYMAIEDAGMAFDQCGKIGIIVASGYGATTTTFNFLDSVLDDGDSCASPTNFSNSLHNVAAAYLSLQLQAFGPSLTVSQFEMSPSSALHTAACWLAQGRVDTVLIGGVDEHNAVLNDYCAQRLYGCVSSAAVADKIEPFAFARQSAIGGEGAAFLLLRHDSSQANYGFIQALNSGHLSQTTPQHNCDLLVLGADGQRNTGNFYAQLETVSPCVSCAPCYGSLPTGQVFDVVAAALMLRQQTTFAPEFSGALQTVSVLKIAADGQFGQIELCSKESGDA